MNIAPPKVELMMRLALRGKLNTKALLYRKGIISPQATLRPCCAEKELFLPKLIIVHFVPPMQKTLTIYWLPAQSHGIFG